MHQFWREPEQELAFPQAFPHQADHRLFEVTQAAVDQLAGTAGGATCHRVLLDDQHPVTMCRRCLGDAGAVDTGADHHYVVVAAHGCLKAASISPMASVSTMSVPWRVS